MADQYRIFLSYRRTDAAGHARALHRDLCRRFERECIFFDRESIESGDEFPGRLSDGVSQSLATVVLIGPDWIDARDKEGNRRLDDPRDFVRQEITLALRSTKKIIPVLFDDTPMPRANVLPNDLAGLARCDALTLRGKTYEYDTQLAELVRLLATVPGMPEPKPLSEVSSKRYLRLAEDLLSDCFSCREAELEALDKALPLGKTIAPSSPVALHGMGGCGKTQLALKFTLDRQEAYTGVWWLRGERPDTLEADFEAFCKECNIFGDEAEPPFPAALRWLAQQPGWLLIFDNADAPDELRPYLKPFKEQRDLAQHHILITSRNPGWAGVAFPIEVKPWRLDQGTAFLVSRLCSRAGNDLAALADRLGGLPLALEQAAAFIEETGTPVADHLVMLTSVDTKDLLQEGRPATGYGRNVVASLSIAGERLTPPAMKLMRLCACLAPEPIPVSLFKAGHGSLPQELRHAAANPLSWNKTLGELVRFGLASRLQIEATGSGIGDELRFHRLTQEVFRGLFGRPEDLQATLFLLSLGIPADPHDPRTWPRGMVLIPHLLRVAGLSVGRKIDAEFLVGTLNRLAVMVLHAGIFRAAEALARGAMEIGESGLGEEHPDTLWAMNTVATALCRQGNPWDARSLAEKVLDVSRRILGEEHPDTLLAMNTVAATLYDQGDLPGARSLQEKVLDVSRRILGEENPDTLLAMLSLSLTLYVQWDLLGARSLAEKVLDARRRILGEEHPDTLLAMNYLATTLYYQRDLPGARSLQEKVLDVSRRILGEEHPDTLLVTINLTATMCLQGNPSGARNLAEKVLDVSCRILGDKHPRTVVSAWNLFCVLQELHETDAAFVVRDKHLAWLLNTESNRLDATQNCIRQALMGYQNRRGVLHALQSLLFRIHGFQQKILPGKRSGNQF